MWCAVSVKKYVLSSLNSPVEMNYKKDNYNWHKISYRMLSSHTEITYGIF